MNDFDFVLTDDKSVGLYDNKVNDIYHSKTGALTEALEKFVIPSFSLIRKDEIKILDICYGIGYNTKAALLQNKNCYIDALEFEKSLVLLSPFIKDGIRDVEIDLVVLQEILKFADFDQIITVMSQILQKNQATFFREDIRAFMGFLLTEGYITNPQITKNGFLHNIYYEYISANKNKYLKPNNIDISKINYYFGDARNSIRELNSVYDVIFLDAFSPQKDPTLWTINFLSLVKERMNENSILVSYSKSTPFRSALCELGFYVGKTFINGIDMGTVASLNTANIINPLSEYDIELLKTRSGITYKDFSLTDNKETILKRREEEQKNSNRLSHTAFLKKML